MIRFFFARTLNRWDLIPTAVAIGLVSGEKWLLAAATILAGTIVSAVGEILLEEAA